MIKLLIYSSEKVYKESSYEGRAEANIIAVVSEEFGKKVYHIKKDRIRCFFTDKVYGYTAFVAALEYGENKIFNNEMIAHLRSKALKSRDYKKEYEQ